MLGESAVSSTHAVIILAAGGSRRLGRAKQLLCRDGEALVHRAVRLAQATLPKRLLLVLGAERERIAQAVTDLETEPVFNSAWEHGLGSGLRLATSLLATHNGVTLVIGCDQPALELRHLQQLIDGALASRSKCAAMIFADGRLGLPAAISARVLRSAQTLGGDRGFGDRLSQLSGIWRLEAPELWLDVDVEADVTDAVAHGWLDDEVVDAVGRNFTRTAAAQTPESKNPRTF
jgi:molybdenum cofactor cytidylyltransferase